MDTNKKTNEESIKKSLPDCVEIVQRTNPVNLSIKAVDSILMSPAVKKE